MGSSHLSTSLMGFLIYDFMEENLISCIVFIYVWLYDIIMGVQIVLFLFDPCIWFRIHLLDMNPNFVCLLVGYEFKILFVSHSSMLLDMNPNSTHLSFFCVVGYEPKFRFSICWIWIQILSNCLLNMNQNFVGLFFFYFLFLIWFCIFFYLYSLIFSSVLSFGWLLPLFPLWFSFMSFYFSSSLFPWWF